MPMKKKREKLDKIAIVDTWINVIAAVAYFELILREAYTGPTTLPRHA
jgi:hypothetical protein